MNSLSEKRGIWFVYDGECTICNFAAEALRIKKEYGELFTLDARDAGDDPLLLEINRRGFDLDEGMVIYTNGQFYHGHEALKFIARYGAGENIFMRIFKGLYWSDILARLTYPWMRGVRNGLLRLRHVERIDNLQLNNEPTFKSVFGSSWEALPPVMKKHYANRPYTQDVTTVHGSVDVICKPPLIWLAPLLKLLGQVPAYNECNVPVTVIFESDPHSKSFHFNRIFNFSNGKPYKFQSRMVQIRNNEVIEIMRFGLGWKLRYSWDGEKVVLAHMGYALHCCGYFMPLPLTLLMGAGYAEEWAIDDNTFAMKTHITHPWWGKVYEYTGRFEVIN